MLVFLIISIVALFFSMICLAIGIYNTNQRMKLLDESINFNLRQIGFTGLHDGEQ